MLADPVWGTQIHIACPAHPLSLFIKKHEVFYDTLLNFLYVRLQVGLGRKVRIVFNLGLAVRVISGNVWLS